MELMSIFLFILLLFTEGWAQRDKQLYCAVCRVMVDEIDRLIESEDPKKTLQTGSFRVDPQGNQNIKEIPYARSDTHLTEVIEEVCKHMNEYAQTTDDDGKKSIVRTSSRNGKPLSLKNININRNIQKQLIFYCDTLIEEHEEDLVALFKRANMPDRDKIICGEIASACTEAELNEPLATLKAEEAAEEIGEQQEDEESEEDESAEEVKEQSVEENAKEEL